MPSQRKHYYHRQAASAVFSGAAFIPFLTHIADAIAGTASAVTSVAERTTIAMTKARYCPDLIPTYLVRALGHLFLAGETYHILQLTSN